MRNEIKARVEKIKSDLEPQELFQLIFNERYSFFLDSALGSDEWGRFSYLGFEPAFVLRASKDTVEIETHKKVRVKAVDALEFLSATINEKRLELSSEIQVPFKGGFLGYISYEWGLSLQGIESSEKKLSRFFWDYELGFYDFVAAYDRKSRDYYLISISEEGDEKKKLVERMLKGGKFSLAEKGLEIRQAGNLQVAMSKEEYVEGVKRVKELIREGYVYVLNLANMFYLKAEVDGLSAYLNLRHLSGADFSACLNFGETRVLSVSPESFIRIRGSRIFTKPIKGTRRRGKTPEEDLWLLKDLKRDEKERAELAMVVDMERNDLSRFCRPSTVKVRSFAEVETFPLVHHLVSLVEGEISEGTDMAAILKAVFPGGSITGAPKISAMKIIDELENFNRGIYTGSIGFFSVCGSADLNIAIRTLVCRRGECFYGAGSGITIESCEEREYEETIVKSAAFFKAMGVEGLKVV